MCAGEAKGRGARRARRIERTAAAALLLLALGGAGAAAQTGTARRQGLGLAGASATAEASRGEAPAEVALGGEALPRLPLERPRLTLDLQELPLEDRAWEAAGELDSEANEATVAERAAGQAGEENEDDATGAGSVRGEAPAAAGLSFAGLATTLQASTLDGLSTEQRFRAGPWGAARGGPAAGASYGQGAVRSVRVLPQSFSAETGGAGGGIAVMARSGGRSGGRSGVHGSAFALTRESALAATNPFSVETHYRDGVVSSAAVKPEGMLNQVGAAVGGPLDGLRWLPLARCATAFGSLEAQMHDDHIVSTPAAANFFALSEEQRALLGTRGVTAAATNAALNYLDSLTGVTARSALRLQGLVRLEVRASERDEVTLGGVGAWLDAPSGAALGQASDAVVARGTGSLGDSEARIGAGTARWLHRFGHVWTAELRGQVARDLEFERAHAPLAQEPGIGPGGYAPQVSIAPEGFAYGTPATLGRSAYPDERRVELGTTLRATLGQHALSVGGAWSRIADRIASLTAEEGAFLYDSGTTNGRDGGLVDWITDDTFNVNAYPNGGCPSITAAVHEFCFRTYTQGFGANPSAAQPGGQAQTAFVLEELAGFGEDAVRLRDNLVVTAGVRYEYTLLPLPQTPNPVLDAALETLARPWGGVTSVFPEDRNNAGPRVSAAWQPRGRWVRRWTVHAGYGLFFGRVPGATVRAALSDTALPNSTTHVRLTPATVTQCPQVTTQAQGFGYACAYTGAPPAAVAQTSSATVLSSRFRSPAVQRGRLELERGLGRRASVRASYAMALATQLPGSVDLNISPATQAASFVLQGGDGYPGLHSGETFVVPLYTARPITAYGPVTAVVSNANETYHAGTLEAEWRGAGVEARGSFTFSRAIDYGPQLSATPSLNGQFDPYTPGYDKGLSTLNFPERFTGTVLYTLGGVRGSAWQRRLANGWRAAAIAVAGSGAPYSYGVFGGTRLSGGHETLNGSGGATWLPTVGRNTLRLPPRGRVDLRVGREFAAGPRLRVNAFAEAYNLLNTQSVAGVETRAFLVGTPLTTGAPTPLIFQDAATVASEGLTTQRPFGAAGSSTTGLSRERQVEFGVRLRF